MQSILMFLKLLSFPYEKYLFDSGRLGYVLWLFVLVAVCLWIIIMKTCACNWDISLFDLLLNILVTSSHLAWGGSFLLRRISWTLLPLLCLFWNVRKYVYKKIYQMFRNMLSSSSAILWIVYMMVKISYHTNYSRFIKQGGMFLCATNHNGSQKSSHPVVVH